MDLLSVCLERGAILIMSARYCEVETTKFGGVQRRGPVYISRLSAGHVTFLPAGVVLLFVFMLSGCWKEDKPAVGQEDISFGVSPRGDSLVFNATGDGGRDLYLLDLAQYRVTRISKSPEREFDPSFSPDGKWIAFSARSPGNRGNHIFVQNVDGGSRRQLTWGDNSDTSPAFSPDGSLLVFARSETYHPGGLASDWDAGESLYLMKFKGSDLRRINTKRLHVIDPRFSPDGKQVIFWEPSGTYLAAIDGTQTPVLKVGPTGRQASFSPDGRLLTYSAGRYAPDQTIFIAQIDGSDTKPIASRSDLDLDSSAGCDRPSFTADGNRIIFLAGSWLNGPGGVLKRNLWEVKIAGGQPRKLANSKLFDEPLGYSPRASE